MKLKLIHLVKIILIIWIIYVSISSISSFIFQLDTSWGNEYGLNEIWNTILIGSDLRAILFIILPIIGLFLKNKFGWFFITSYLFFFATNIFFQMIELDVLIDPITLFIASFLILIISLIFIMNLKKIKTNYYRIEKHLTIINFIAFFFGFCQSILLFYLKSY